LYKKPAIEWMNAGMFTIFIAMTSRLDVKTTAAVDFCLKIFLKR